jgi:hypothetical protein
MRRHALLLLAGCIATPAWAGDSYVLPDGISRAPAITLHCATQGMNAAPCGTTGNPVPVTSQTVGIPNVGAVVSIATTPVIILPGLGSASARRYFFHIWNFGAANLYCTDDGSTQPSASSASFVVFGNGGGYEKDAPAFVSNQALNCVAGAGSVTIRVESLP